MGTRSELNELTNHPSGTGNSESDEHTSWNIPQVCACYLWAVVRCGLHSDDDLVLQRMRNFITSKQNLRVLQQLTDHTHTHTQRKSFDWWTDCKDEQISVNDVCAAHRKNI